MKIRSNEETENNNLHFLHSQNYGLRFIHRQIIENLMQKQN